MMAERSQAIRLQKLLSMAGVSSRRAAETLIVEGRVTVNGRVVTALGSKADPDHDEVRVDGRRVKAETDHRYLALNKPRGYVTTRHDPEGRRTVMDLLRGVQGHVYPIGRLDYDSEGLLLLTSDGTMAAELMHPSHGVERVYEAVVRGLPRDETLKKLREGVFIDGRRTIPAEVRRGHTTSRGDRQLTLITITLREGRNRQVRKMCAAVGHPVRRLTRVRMGPIALGHLKPGEWRELTSREISALRAHEGHEGIRIAPRPRRAGASRR
jgi:23S rRNA pseudouridine2605 synthase